MKDFLTKLLSKAAFAKATELIQGQGQAGNAAQANASHEAVVEGLYRFVEDLDDKVELIPFAGPILKALVDNPAADARERELCEFIVESAYRALKYGEALRKPEAATAETPMGKWPTQE